MGHHGRAALPFVLLAAGAGCVGDAPSCEEHFDAHCEHPIDRLLLPRLRALGVEPREAEPAEYCRRLAIDLNGRIPSSDELAACVALPDAAARVDAAMASPLYGRTMRRAFGEVLGYDNFLGWSDEVVELDDLVGRLYADEIGYGDFAATVAVHPGFLGLHRDDAWPAALFSIFLGRPARADEIAGFRPLGAIWQPRYFCEGHVFWAVYSESLDEGFDAAAAELDAEDVCADLARADWAVNFCWCDPEETPGGCVSDVLGQRIELSGRCPNPSDPYADDNLMRIDPREPGDDDTCPDGVHRPECVDRETDFELMGLDPIRPLPLIDGAGRAELAEIGRALTARGDFWEAAVDREARLLLGWWQTTFRQPDSDLPEVRRLLAERLRAGGSVREMQRLILTSQLYAAPASAPAVTAERVPDFAMAPTKLMAAETWLDSAAAAVGEASGVCDFRFVNPEGYYETALIDPRLAEPMPDSIYDAHVEDSYYPDFAIRLGGCNSEARRPTISNVGMAFAERELSRMLCAYGAGVLPEGWDGDLASGARHVVAAALGRTLGEEEAAALAGEMQACLDAGPDAGCADPETAVRWLCQRALESAEFSTY